MKKYLMILMTGILLSGCVATITPVGPPPPPPPPQVEVYSAAPWPGAVWIAGGWVWRPRYQRYVWRHGYWH